MMKVIDLFCGCGGLSLGFQQAGYSIIGAFDDWQVAVDTYNANMSHEALKFDLANVPDFMRKISGNIPDTIIGGPPCQDFSSAGKRQESTRADLTRAYANIIDAVRPNFFVMENVARARHSKTYQVARNIFSSAGYGLTEMVVDASLCGVPQKRKRFFCVGAQGAEDGFMTSIVSDSLSGKKMTVRDYMGDEIDVNHYYRHPRNYNRRAVFSIDEPSATIRGVSRPVPKGYRGHPLDSAEINESLRPLSTIERARIQTFPRDYQWKGSKSDVEQMIGNAVPVNLAAFVARCLSAYIKNQDARV